MQLPLCFFNVVLETAIRCSKVGTRETVFGNCSQIMAYADDVVSMRRILQNTEEVFMSLVELTNMMRFKINDIKTKFMLVSQKPWNECEYTGTIFFFFDHVHHVTDV
jgi:hypothetical protein